MLQIKENKKKILKLFFKFPFEKFHLREISRKTKISVTSVKKYLNELIEEKLVIKIEKGIYPTFISNREGDDGNFKFYKKLNTVEELRLSGLFEFIEDNCFPSSVILFGSASLGEDVEGSDIDLFIQAEEKKLNLKKFEKKFGREINLFFEKNFSELNKHLKNNVLNGIVLGGYLQVFK